MPYVYPPYLQASLECIENLSFRTLLIRALLLHRDECLCDCSKCTFKHQPSWSSNLIDRFYRPRGINSTVGWLKPGTARRHAAPRRNYTVYDIVKQAQEWVHTQKSTDKVPNETGVNATDLTSQTSGGGEGEVDDEAEDEQAEAGPSNADRRSSRAAKSQSQCTLLAEKPKKRSKTPLGMQAKSMPLDERARGRALAKDKSTGSARNDPTGEEADAGVSVEHKEECSAVCRWVIPGFSKLKQRTTRCLWSRYFEVGGYDCRLLVYPTGDSQALPGYISIYLQVTDPKNATGKWDCFASYRLCIANQDEAKNISRDSWHRFSAKRKSHGWCDFVQGSNILEPGAGFATNDSIQVQADILVLSESTQFTRENELASAVTNASSEVLSGKFTWKVRNFGLFRDMIKTQKIMSPAFSAGECSLRLSVYQSVMNGTDHLSMCLESKDTDKTGNAERSCWCLFRMSVMTQAQKGRPMHRDSYGRFAADSKTGDNTSLGWNDFMSVTAFTDPEAGFLVDNTAIFCASFHIIKESSTFNRSMERGLSVKAQRTKGRAGDTYQGKFTWKIEHFTKLKELLKKRKITGLCIKSRRFQVGSRDCRLIVYPRGQSQPPNHLSMFLEVTDPGSSNPDWSCFVSHRLSVVNQRGDDKSVAKESQNRYSKQAKDWGWREFVTLTSLFDLDAGFLVNDCVVFAAEVLVLRETSDLKALPDAKNLYLEYHSAESAATLEQPMLRFSWRIENFVAFKEIMETRKIFSKQVF